MSASFLALHACVEVTFAEVAYGHSVHIASMNYDNSPDCCGRYQTVGGQLLSLFAASVYTVWTVGRSHTCTSTHTLVHWHKTIVVDTR